MKEIGEIYVLLEGLEVVYIYKVDKLIPPISGVDVTALEVATGRVNNYSWCLPDLRKDRKATKDEVELFKQKVGI